MLKCKDCGHEPFWHFYGRGPCTHGDEADGNPCFCPKFLRYENEHDPVEDD